MWLLSLIATALVGLAMSSVNKQNQKDLMDYSADINQDFYDKNQSPQAMMDKWTGMGMNPNLVAASLLGSGVGQSASAISGNPSVDSSATSGLLNMFTQMTGQSLQRFLDDDEIQSRIDLNQSSSLLNGVNAGLRPLEFAEQQRVNDATITKFLADANLSGAQKDFVNAQRTYLKYTTAAQITKDIASAREALANARLLYEKSRSQYDLDQSQIAVNKSVVDVNDSLAKKYDAETSGQLITNDILWDERVMKHEFMTQVKSYGCQLSSDAVERIAQHVAAGEFDKADDLLNALSNAQEAKENGKNSAAYGAPEWNILYHNKFPWFRTPGYGQFFNPYDRGDYSKWRDGSWHYKSSN